MKVLFISDACVAITLWIGEIVHLCQLQLHSSLDCAFIRPSASVLAVCEAV